MISELCHPRAENQRKVKQMAKLPSKNIFASETADSFGGLDRIDSIGSISKATEMANMRVLPDGSLTRREGSTVFVNFPSPVRCAAVCPTDPNYLFVMAGDRLYSVNLTTNRALELSRGFNTYAPSFFFRIQDSVYLFSEGWYALIPDNMVSSYSYVPLVGHNWGADGGPVYEHQNMLSLNIRIDYLLDRDTNTLFTGYDLSSIDAVYVNGKAVTGSHIEQKRVCLPAVFPAGTRVLLCLSLSLAQIQDALSLLSCTASYSCGKGQDSIAIGYGGEEPDRLFIVSHKDEDKVAEAQVYYPNSGNIYCSAAPTYVKELTGGVRAVCGEPDCLLVAGQHEIRRLTPEGESSILDMEGCDSSVNMAYFDDTAYVATPKGIWQLPLRSGRGKLISAALGDRMDQSISEKAMLYYNTFRGELWVKDTTSYSGTVYVYDPAREVWVCFESINADGFFDYYPGRTVGYYHQLQLVKFVDGQNYDVTGNGNRSPIFAYYLSRWTDLGKPYDTKRLRRISMNHTGYGNVTVLIMDGNEFTCPTVFEANSSIMPTFNEKSVRSSRTKQFCLAMYSEEQSPFNIHEITLSAIK